MSLFNQVYLAWMGSMCVLIQMILNPTSLLLRGAGIMKAPPQIVGDMRSRVVIVTGSNTGIGLETARSLAEMGATVVLAVRSIERGEAARKDIETHLSQCKAVARSGKVSLQFAEQGKVLVRQLDLSDLDSVKKFAEAFLKDFDRLDVLVNNAGLASINLPGNYKTKQGIEYVFGTNYVGHFLLTQLLLDRLKKSSDARIVNLSSVMHHFASGADITRTAAGLMGSAHDGYNDSKLAMIFFTKELNRRLRDTSVQAVAVNPGWVASDIWRNMGNTPVIGGLVALVWEGIMKFCALTVEQGATPSIFAASQSFSKGLEYFSPYWVPDGWWLPFEMGGPFVGPRPLRPRLPPNEPSVSAELWRITEGLIVKR